MIDNRGTELKVGQHVAYNHSGQITKGEITWVKDRIPFNFRGTRVKVRLLHDAVGKRKGHESKIKNERTVLVLLGNEK